MATDPYPTEDELKRVREWPGSFVTLLEFVRSLWWNPEWGWEQRGTKYYISTGGWSGNEDLIDALRDHKWFWMFCWVSSRRGGHYRFKIHGSPVEAPQPEPPEEGK